MAGVTIPAGACVWAERRAKFSSPLWCTVVGVGECREDI